MSSLKERISNAQKRLQESKKKESKTFKIIVEIFSSTAVGGFLGYGIDCYFEIKNIFLSLGLILGLASGVYNIYKSGKDKA